MQMFDYEYLLEDIKEYAKKNEDQRKQDEKQQNGMKMPNMNSYMSSFQSSMPKVNIPKI
jgi:anti-sigma regulatory factor (Ser/Thr protein kinase)